MATTINCTCCGASAEIHKSVACCTCSKPYKIDCVNVSSAEARKIHSKSGLLWSCKTCTPVGNDINELKNLILALSNEVQTLKTTISNLSTNCSSSKLPLQQTEEIIQEVFERNKRQCNLIIYNVKETSGVTSREQSALDVAIINDLALQLNIPSPTANPVRLGKFDATNASQSRPIKMRLNSADDVLVVTTKFKKLKAQDKWNAINVSKDRTPMEIAYYKSVREDMHRRLEAGETNLKIKYRNGLPTVVRAEN